MLKQLWIVTIPLFFLLLPTPSLAKEPVKIGFVGGLTGKLSDLGTAGRNGVILAVEEKNARGGLLGRPIDLLTRDDKQDPKEAIRVDEELIGQGVIAIIGHMTSAMSMAAKPLIDSKRVLMISPTTSTTALSGQKDFFFRVQETLEGGAKALSEFVIKKRGLRTLGGVYDLSNRAYTEDYLNHFKANYEKLGGRLFITESFVSGKETPFSGIVQKIKNAKPQGFLIVASAADTAMFCQQATKLGWKVPLILSGWGMTDELPRLGGRSVEGALSVIDYDSNYQTPGFQKFLKSFSERFGREPGFPGHSGYESAQVLFKAYEEAKGEVSKLPETILKIKTFQGLQGNIVIDEYGDALRPKFITTILNGQFKVIK